MDYNRVSHEFSQEDLDWFKQEINAFRERIKPALVTLPRGFRSRLKTIGNRMHPFVEQALDYAGKFPLLAPANFNFAEFQKDWKLTMQVKSILKDAEALVESLYDIFLVAGGDALAHARNFYGSVKNAALHGEENAITVAEELKKTYKTGRLKPEEERLLNEFKKTESENKETVSA